MHTTQLHERVARTLMFLNISQVDFTCGLELVAIAFFFAFASHKMRLICVFNHQVQGHNRKGNPLPLTSNIPETSGLILYVFMLRTQSWSVLSIERDYQL
jgi:hypothetical protein